jgi:quercetin dioxygenase-like cupin family protein
VKPTFVDPDDPAATDDLNVTVVRLRPDERLPPYTNDSLDVLIVVLAGTGELDCDEQAYALGPATVVVVPRGAQRAVRAGADGLEYVSAHRRRSGLGFG